MKFVISIVLIAIAALIGWLLYDQWKAVSSDDGKNEIVIHSPSAGSQLPGMEPQLESYLETSKRRGAKGLRDFLARYGRTIKDPRLAWIELDYVVLLAKEDPVEARKVFARVKQRTPQNSPVYSRVKQLEKTFE